jgi:hypothetical protein
VRDYRAEVLAWIERAEKCVNPPGGYYGNASGDDLHPNHALASACEALRVVVDKGSIANLVALARALGLEPVK